MRLRMGLLLVVGLLAACSGPATTPFLLPTSTTLPTLSPTPSPVWFPPTETPTLAPTLTPRPTQEYKPGVGSVILEDDFTHPEDWRTGDFEDGRITFGNRALNLVVTAPRGSLFSFGKKEIPADSYLEITIEPAICRNDDVFGVMLRARSEREGYRLLGSCNGNLRMERLRPSETIPLQDWTASGELPRGGMLPVRVGVWMAGSELRVFLNDVYQFSVRDPLYSSGQVGLYARASGNTSLTVAFSNLRVHSLDPSRLPTSTPMPAVTP